MKRIRIKAVVGLAGTALGVVCLAGCATSGYTKSNSAAASMRVAAERIDEENRALGATVGALDDMETNAATDLKQQFHYYSRALDYLYDSVKRAENATQDMQSKSADYFQYWDKQFGVMNYQSVRDLSQSRRASVSNQVEQVMQRYRDTREAILPVVAYLEDIRKALEADLTPGGLASVKDVVRNASTNAQKVQTALVRLHADLSASSAQLSSAAPEPSQASIENGDSSSVQRADIGRR